MVIKSPVLALLALGALPFLNIAATRFSKRIAPVNLALQQELADLSGVVEESLAGVRVVKGFGAERMQVQAARGRGRQRPRSGARRGEAAGRVHPAHRLPADALAGRDPLVRRPPGARRPARGRRHPRLQPLHPHAHLAAADGRHADRPGIPRLGRRPGGCTRSSSPTRRSSTGPARSRLPPGPGEVRFEGVQFGYGPGRTVLNGLDLTIRGGEAVALVGATGSGKTTVARLLPAVLRRRGGPRAASTASTCASIERARAAEGHRHRVRGHVPVLRHGPREHRVRRPGGVAGRGPARGAARRAPRRSSTRCPTATTRSSASTGSRSRVASGSASRSPAR